MKRIIFVLIAAILAISLNSQDRMPRQFSIQLKTQTNHFYNSSDSEHVQRDYIRGWQWGASSEISDSMCANHI
jgi:hypothetical protein